MLVGRCCPELSGHKHKKSQPLSEARDRLVTLHSALSRAESKGPTMPILLMLVKLYQPTDGRTMPHSPINPEFKGPA